MRVSGMANNKGPILKWGEWESTCLRCANREVLMCHGSMLCSESRSNMVSRVRTYFLQWLQSKPVFAILLAETGVLIILFVGFKQITGSTAVSFLLVLGLLLTVGRFTRRMWRRWFEDERERMSTISQLEERADPAAIMELADEVSSPARFVSRRAAFALFRIGSPEASEALRTAVRKQGVKPSLLARFLLWRMKRKDDEGRRSKPA